MDLDCAPSIRAAGGARVTILVKVDNFSKFVILVPLMQLTSQAVAQAFLERILAVYGRPLRVRIDGGAEFMGEFRGLVQGLGIEVVCTIPLSPWTNGIAECMVHFVKYLIRKTLIGVPKEEWLQTVPWVQAAINATISRTT